MGNHEYYIMVALHLKGYDTMRNIYTQINQGLRIIEKHKKADMIYCEVREFLRNFDEADKKHGLPFAVYSTIEDAFLMGVAVGYRISKVEDDPSMNPMINLK